MKLPDRFGEIPGYGIYPLHEMIGNSPILRQSDQGNAEMSKARRFIEMLGRETTYQQDAPSLRAAIVAGLMKLGDGDNIGFVPWSESDKVIHAVILPAGGNHHLLLPLPNLEDTNEITTDTLKQYYIEGYLLGDRPLEFRAALAGIVDLSWNRRFGKDMEQEIRCATHISPPHSLQLSTEYDFGLGKKIARTVNYNPELVTVTFAADANPPENIRQAITSLHYYCTYSPATNEYQVQFNPVLKGQKRIELHPYSNNAGVNILVGKDLVVNISLDDMMPSRITAGRNQEYYGARALAERPEITLPMIATNIHTALNDTSAKVEWANLKKLL